MCADTFRTQNETLTDTTTYALSLPRALWFIAEVSDLLADMCDANNWEQDGSVTVEQATEAALSMYRSFSPMIGEIKAVMLANIPDNCLICDGSTHHRTDYPALYASISSVFYVDADHFRVPDLRGKMLVGATFPGYLMGSTGGEATHTLTVPEMPAHSHTDTGHSHTIPSTVTFLALTGEEPVVVPVPLVPSFTGTSSANLANTGGGGAHNNMPPYVAIGYVVVAK